MKKIIIFSGTTEGRTLSEFLAESGIPHCVSVATDYGELVMQEHPLVTIHKGRLTEDAMIEYLRENQFQIVVDATHPYATEVTKTIHRCVTTLVKEKNNVTYLRLEREIEADQDQGMRFFSDNEACVKALKQIPGNILLTTGSKELAIYCNDEELRKRLYARVLPGVESLSICLEQGLLPKQILALQGPFSTELNEALLHQFDVTCMVTKQGGATGGFPEKQMAARKAGVPLFVIQKENVSNEVIQNEASSREFVQKEQEGLQGLSFREVCDKLETIAGITLAKQAELDITLAGVGMGDLGTLTVEVQQQIEQADLILGASRVIEPYLAKIEKEAIYMPADILSYLEEKSSQYAYKHTLKVAVLFSGDSGFYSGCKKVRECLEEAIFKEQIQGTIRVCPGISSIQMMSAACGISWQDAGIYSIHGRTDKEGWQQELLQQIRSHKNLFLLVSGAKDIRMLGQLLYEGCRVYVGYQLSYPEQSVTCLTPEQCKNVEEEGLYVVVIQNDKSIETELNLGQDTSDLKNEFCASAEKDVITREYQQFTPGISDDTFIRAKVPMTKEEIREVSLCKLRLQPDSVLYDIGSGTGSIAVEAASLSKGLRVYAIEQKEEAIDLLCENKEKFQTSNITIVEGVAPASMKKLERPTHAFIGGSGGHLMEILKELYQKNSNTRVVINAISLETVVELEQIPKQFKVKDFELVQLQVSRYRELGAYLMPKAENPIMICSFEF